MNEYFVQEKHSYVVIEWNARTECYYVCDEFESESDADKFAAELNEEAAVLFTKDSKEEA